MFVSIPQRFETPLLRLSGQPLQSRADRNSLMVPAGIETLPLYRDRDSHSKPLQAPAGAYIAEFEVSEEDPAQALNVARRPMPVKAVRVESARQPAEESGTSPRSEPGRFPGGDPI